MKEFECPCCGKNLIDESVVTKIDLIRTELGVPLRINSGFRCAKHNKEVGGKSNSMHLLGYAIDVSILNLTPQKKLEFLELALKYFNGIGISKSFFHLDIGDRRLWVY